MPLCNEGAVYSKVSEKLFNSDDFRTRMEAFEHENDVQSSRTTEEGYRITVELECYSRNDEEVQQ